LKVAQGLKFTNIHGCKFWRSAHHSAKPTLEWWTTDNTSIQLVARVSG